MTGVGALAGESFGPALRELREKADLSLRDLARKVHCSHSHLADLESGRRCPGAQLATNLDEVLEAGGELLQLAPEAPDAGTFCIRSHKFVAAYVGDDVLKLVDTIGAQSCGGLLADHWSAPADRASRDAVLHLWRHGSTLHHLVEQGEWSTITDLARWRYASYEKDLAWASERLSRALGYQVSASYILSVYWLARPAWTGERLHNALRLICSPRILVGDSAAGPSRPGVETSLLRDGFPHPDNVQPFGTADAAVGYASWSGVVYLSQDHERALNEQDIVEVELAAQSLWQYCSWIAGQVEEGQDPQVNPDYGWRWLRAAQSRITTARLMALNDLGQSCSPIFPTWWRWSA